MKQTIVWGCGRKLTEIVNSLPALLEYIDIFIDSNVELFMGIETHKPDVLQGKQINDLQIIICTVSQTVRKEIERRIISEFKIDPGCIVSENEWVADELSKHDELLLRPSSVRLEASTLCQLNCVTCPMREEHYSGLGKGYLKFSDFKHFIEDNDFVRNIELSNYGEVFLNPELKEIIHFAGIKGIRLTMNNGVNFNYADQEVLEEIVKSKAVRSMTVSIDGASQEVYQKYRRNGNFYHVIENIRRLNVLKKKFHSEYPRLRWQYVLFDYNENEAEKAKQISVELNMDIVFKLDWSNSKWVPQNREKLERVTKMKYFNRTEYEINTGDKYLSYHSCRPMFFQPQINYDGRLLGCCRVRSSDWGENVFHVGLVAALNNSKYRNAVIMLLGKGNVREDTPCAKCKCMETGRKNARLVL